MRIVAGNPKTGNPIGTAEYAEYAETEHMLLRAFPRILHIPRFRNGTHIGFNPARTKRSPKAARRPKPEYTAVLGDQQPTAPGPIQISDFGLLSDFGLRTSDFKPGCARCIYTDLERIFAVLIASMLLATLSGCGPAPSEGPPPAAVPVTVQIVLPKHGEIARTITLPSFRILAYQEATLYAKVSGYLKTLTVDKGDAVKEGQLLAEIEVPELLADEVQYKVETAVCRTNYERMAAKRQG